MTAIPRIPPECATLASLYSLTPVYHRLLPLTARLLRGNVRTQIYFVHEISIM
jgi:hypothetical protein